MKTKEKLERSGWKFKQGLDYHYEIYGRNNLRIIYDKTSDKPLALYDIFDTFFKEINEIDFECLTEKEC